MGSSYKKSCYEDEEKLVDHITIVAYSDPIPLQLLDLWFGMVAFGEIDLYNFVDEKPITVHVNISVIWQNNTPLFTPTGAYSSYSFKCKLWKQYAYSTNVIALIEDVYSKVKTPVGFYTIRVELHIKEDNSSKVVEIPGVMFYYLCMLSTGPFLLTYIKMLLRYDISYPSTHPISQS